MTDRPPPGSPAPRWVVLTMLLIAAGWVLFFCVVSGLLSGPTGFTTAKRPAPTRPPADALGAVVGGSAVADRIRE